MWVILKKVLRFVVRSLNRPVKRSYWYQELFSASYGEIVPWAYSWKRDSPRNFDVIAVGSSAGYWDIKFDNERVRGLNFSHAPQRMIYDYRILRYCHSFLREHGTALFIVCPLSSVARPETAMDALRYMRFFERPDMCLRRDLYEQALEFMRNPLKLGMPAVKAGIRVLLHMDRPTKKSELPNLRYNTLTSNELMEDAKHWMSVWKRDFGITDFDYPLTDEQEFGRAYKIFLMNKMIDFCEERGYRPAIVVPPVSKCLLDHFTTAFLNTYVNSYLSEFSGRVPVLNYLYDEQFQDPSLYFNSFFMNAEGRKVFTDRVLSDVGLLDPEH